MSEGSKIPTTLNNGILYDPEPQSQPKVETEMPYPIIDTLGLFPQL